MKFHENLSSGNRVVPCGRTDRQTDMMKLIVAFRSLRERLKRQEGLKGIFSLFEQCVLFRGYVGLLETKLGNSFP